MSREIDPDELPPTIDPRSALDPATRAASRAASQGGTVEPVLGAGDGNVSQEILDRLEAHGMKQTRYRVRGEVARGGMGMILKVWDEDLRRNLAMKVVMEPTGDGTTTSKAESVNPKTLGRFLEEAQVTGQLDHPGIVPVHELGLDSEGRVFFTMRLVRGKDLAAIFEMVKTGEEGWSQTRALWAMLKVCEAMAYAHRKKVIHRDLKPANIMAGRFGEVYVMDWGLARVLETEDKHDIRVTDKAPDSHSLVESERRMDESHSPDSVLFTQDGDVLGTPAYMSPEQARGEIETLGPRSDVYSVGAILYHLLSGSIPFVPPGATKISQHMILFRLMEGPPPPLDKLAPDLPAELIAICEKAMEREPGDRYESMTALADDLRAYLEHRVVSAYETGAVAELKKWVARNKVLAAVSAGALFSVVAGLGAVGFVQARGKQIADLERGKAVEAEGQAPGSRGHRPRQRGRGRTPGRDRAPRALERLAALRPPEPAGAPGPGRGALARDPGDDSSVRVLARGRLCWRGRRTGAAGRRPGRGAPRPAAEPAGARDPRPAHRGARRARSRDRGPGPRASSSRRSGPPRSGRAGRLRFRRSRDASGPRLGVGRSRALGLRW